MTHWTEFVDPDGPDGAYLPWKKVEPRVGISRTTAWRLQKTGDFPKPYVISPGRVAYRESEVEAWKASRGHRSAADRKAPQVSPAASSQTSQGTSTGTPLPGPEPFDPSSAVVERPGLRPPGPPRGRARQKRSSPDQMSLNF